MRVIAGTARGHTLKAPKGYKTRPTLDRIREAIFNVLASRIQDSNVLDLYAGSGAMGIEALSRGAAKCVFNDQNSQALKVVKDNLLHTKLENQAVLYNKEALKAIKLLEQEGNMAFDLVFLDPPYQAHLYDQILVELQDSRLLKKDSLVVVESDAKLVLNDYYGALRRIKESRYGDTLVTYYKYMEE